MSYGLPTPKLVKPLRSSPEMRLELAWCTTLRPSGYAGLVSFAITQRGPSRPSTVTRGVHQLSRPLARYVEGIRADDEVGRPELRGETPLGSGGQLRRGRRVGGITLRRAGVRPGNDRLDLLCGERGVVLERLDADVAVDVPRRHLAGGDLRPDPSGVAPGGRVVEQREGPDSLGLVAFHAIRVEDLGHVSGPGHVLGRCRLEAYHQQTGGQGQSE